MQYTNYRNILHINCEHPPLRYVSTKISYHQYLRLVKVTTVVGTKKTSFNSSFDTTHVFTLYSNTSLIFHPIMFVNIYTLILLSPKASESHHFNLISSCVAICRNKLKSTAMWDLQKRRTLPHTSAGKQGEPIPCSTRAMDRPHSECSTLYSWMNERMSPRTHASFSQLTYTKQKHS